MQNLSKFSELIYLVIYFHRLKQLGALVSGSIQIFPSVTMSGLAVRLVLFISGILSDSRGISLVKLLFWLIILWLALVL